MCVLDFSDRHRVVNLHANVDVTGPRPRDFHTHPDRQAKDEGSVDPFVDFDLEILQSRFNEPGYVVWF